MKYFIGKYERASGGNLWFGTRVHVRLFWNDETKRTSFTGDKSLIRHIKKELTNPSSHISNWFRGRLKTRKQRFKEL